MVALLKQCCCGCTLRTGTIIIAVLEILGSLYSVGVCLLAEIVINSDLPPNAPMEAVHWKHFLTSISTVLLLELVFRFVLLILSIVMLVGAIKDKRKLLLPWIVCEILAIIDVAVQGIWIAVVFAHENVAISAYISLFIGLPLAIYLLYVVYSHYEIMGHRRSQQVV